MQIFFIMEMIESIEKYITNDMILLLIKNNFSDKNYNLYAIDSDYDPGLCKTGKDERYKEVWEISLDNSPVYRLHYDSIDSHFTDKRGKDFYKTTIKNLEGKTLFETSHTHINTPAIFSDEDEYSNRIKDLTILHHEDVLALFLFNKIKQNY